jgi:NSS family neurotransmitter:Na+ symporter
MAVGAGNIWRFPRVAAEHGGGAFMLAWLVALFCWSIPLLIIEFSWGKKSRNGPIGAFFMQVGSRWGWAGGFVAVCCTAIMFYYAVVTGWCLYYFFRHSFVGLEAGTVESEWQQFAGSGWALVFLVVALAIAVAVVLLGVRRGIERVCKVLVPSLFVLLVVAAVRALLLPGAAAGLEHLFRPNFHLLLDHQVWLEAFSQSAWSTGAGWGLYLVYAGYARKREDVVLNSFITGLGNNAASLLAALAIIPAIFALLPPAEASAVVASGNEGLAFVWIPRLFLGGDMLGGGILLVVFFAALSVAALSSLIAMVELGVRTLMDLGLTRNRAAAAVALLGFGLGTPSALSMGVFKNQDWVWGLGLLVSGALFAAGTIFYGAGRLRREINASADGSRLYGWFDLLVYAVIPVAFVAMLGWWFYQASVWDPEGWLDPLGKYSAGTCLVQWGAVLIILVLCNRWLHRRGVGR